MPQIIKNEDKYEVSVYTDQLSIQTIIDQFRRIQYAFPALGDGFYEILSDRINNIGFTDKRLSDSVNQLIDTCTYPTPTIANIISFDKRIKLYTHADLVKHLNENPFKYHKRIKHKGKFPLYAKITDIEQFNIELDDSH